MGYGDPSANISLALPFHAGGPWREDALGCDGWGKAARILIFEKTLFDRN